MLKLSKCSKHHCDLTTVIDEYVPLHLDIGISKTSIDELYYWRSTDQYSLMEIGIDSGNGRLLGIDVLLIPARLVSIVKSINAVASMYNIRDEGIPVFDLAPWIEKIGMQESPAAVSKRRVDEKAEFELLVAHDGVGVIFSGCRQLSRLTLGRASFLIDRDDSFCGFLLEGISKQDFNRLIGFAN